MKKSERYYEAMRAVLRAGIHDEYEIIEIMETLQDNLSTAKWAEKQVEEDGAPEKEVAK